ncbi:MAG: hypothetical protein AMJ92_03390 [candidate division Zixibacteria bacterium SM23_81]|nr:MAG: hypothetical protein AMJ92_03390 [candidate division Zixibacteria bacterium SM23_81]
MIGGFPDISDRGQETSPISHSSIIKGRIAIRPYDPQFQVFSCQLPPHLSSTLGECRSPLHFHIIAIAIATAY